MSSSTSSSEAPAAWGRFLRWVLGFAAVLLGIVYGFIALVDPWGMLPAAPELPRLAVTTNQRFSYPMLARDPRFDSVVIGTSTSRLLQPAALNEAMGGRFANLAMNSGTAWEQMELLGLFLRSRAAPRRVVIGLDSTWCESGPLQRLTPRPFPEWMYGDNLWRGYREILNPFAAEEAGKQALAMMGLARARYGRDGYANFLPDDSRYDLARVAPLLQPPAWTPAPAAAPGFIFPQHELLATQLARMPASTQLLLFFVPYYGALQPPAGTLDAMRWQACKDGIAAVARTRPGTVIADFMIPSRITQEATNYWDPLHYRIGIAGELARELTKAAEGTASPDYSLVVAP